MTEDLFLCGTHTTQKFCDVDWITPRLNTFEAGQCESASRSLSRLFTPGTKRRLGKTTRSATQDALAHILLCRSHDCVTPRVSSHPEKRPAPSERRCGSTRS